MLFSSDRSSRKQAVLDIDTERDAFEFPEDPWIFIGILGDLMWGFQKVRFFGIL